MLELLKFEEVKRGFYVELCHLAETRTLCVSCFSLDSDLFYIYVNHPLFLWCEEKIPHQDFSV